MSNPFGYAPADSEVGSKYGNTSGTHMETIYPVTEMLHGEAREGQPTASLESLTLAEFCDTLNSVQKSAATKLAMPNPKHSVLQSTYDESEECSIVETSQPLLLSTWASQYAIGPSAMELHMTFSPSWRSDIMTSPTEHTAARMGTVAWFRACSRLLRTARQARFTSISMPLSSTRSS